jgi:hypothetical protein
MKIPMREKYVDEAIGGPWFVWGESSMDVVNERGDVFVSLPPDVAERIVALHSQFRQQLYSVLCQK